MGSDPQPWALVSVDSLNGARRRLTYRLSDGRRRSVIVAQGDDSNENRNKIGDALESENRRLIRGGTNIEG